MKKLILFLALATGFTANAQLNDADMAEIDSLMSYHYSPQRQIMDELMIGSFEGVESSIYSVRFQNDWGTFLELGWRSESNFSALEGDNVVTASVGMSYENKSGFRYGIGYGVLVDLNAHSNGKTFFGSDRLPHPQFSSPLPLVEGQISQRVYKGIDVALKAQLTDPKFANVFVGVMFDLK